MGRGLPPAQPTWRDHLLGWIVGLTILLFIAGGITLSVVSDTKRDHARIGQYQGDGEP